MSEYKQIVEESFTQYAGAVIQSRALVDVRDGLKPSARQIFYSMLLHKLTSDKPHKKTANAVGLAMADFYIHGDSSCEGVIMRAGQHFAMRYPLIDVKGNAGTPMESGNWAAPRYTESRLSKISDVLFEDINKDTIGEWRDSYDNTKQYPAVLPTKGFYNIVNGTSGIAVGMASNVPQYNLNDVNNALIHLIDNPNCSFEEIYCAPDFATGAILYNEDQVKESMKKGTGFACKLRSVVEYDKNDRCFIVTEIPYGVYTNTICGQLENIINEVEDKNKKKIENPGIESFKDLTGEKPLIKIYLQKKANPDKALKYLYKNTSLQYYYGINFTMLDHGRKPKIFSWKEMLQAHIDHEKEVYRRGFEFDLSKIDKRIHIIDGLLLCLADIDEVVKIIKSSKNTSEAESKLISNFALDSEQAKAVLDMKLSRLAHLEVKKLEDEKAKLKLESDRIHAILENEELFNNELKNGWREVAKKYGDARRTKLIQLAESDNEEPIEIKQLSLSFTNKDSIIVNETSSLYSQKRNGVGAKFKLDKEEYVIDSLIGENTDTILFFTNKGNFYHKKMGEFIIGEKQYLPGLDSFGVNEHVVAASILSKSNTKENIIFLTKNGILKKSKISEYNLKRSGGAQALKLDTNDEIVNVIFTNEDRIGILSHNGNFIIIETKDIKPIGRVARGIIGIKLDDSDYVVSSKIIEKSDYIISITEDGYIKKTNLSEFSVTGRNTKGSKIQKSNNNICDFILSLSQKDVLIVSSNAQIRIKYDEIPLLSRGAQGVKSLKLSENSKIIKMLNC